MAPKKLAISDLGRVRPHYNGWRAKVEFRRDLIVYGPTHHGPAARRKAEADLAQAREASTRDEMQRRLREMTDRAAPAAPPVAVGHAAAPAAPPGPPPQPPRKRLRGKAPAQRSGAPLDRALVIKPEWCEQIFAHGKRWEIRGEPCNRRGRFAIAESGTCTLVGEATLVDCFRVGMYNRETERLVPYSEEEIDSRLFLGRPEHFEKHRITDLSIVKYPVVYAWVLAEPRKYEEPIPYVHPQGAIKWVILNPS